VSRFSKAEIEHLQGVRIVFDEEDFRHGIPPYIEHNPPAFKQNLQAI
jgi:hypothetical protein